MSREQVLKSLLFWIGWGGIGWQTVLSAEPAAVSSNGRAIWTTSRIQGSPDPPSPYRTQIAFPHLKFDEPDAMTFVPGSGRLAVVERFGKIYTFENDPQTRERHLLIDLAKVLGTDKVEVFGIAFHPKFSHNGLFFLHHRRHDQPELPTRVSRFRVRTDDRWQVDPQSELLLIRWPAGHDGGCLDFGPDGYLYISNGDEGGFHDPSEVGQRLDDLQSSILRIDVEGGDQQQPYKIPSDNPFVDLPHARPEVWAYGFRNPWKFSFDRDTGQLWTADVGEDLWESVHLVRRGGNYGWSVQEGGHPFRPERATGPTPIEPPIVAHDHSEARSITGGFVYRGAALPQLKGHYVYGDYDTGKVWMLGYDGQQVTVHRELCDTSLRIVSFAEDHSRELYLVDHIGGYIHQLVENQEVDRSSTFPRKLSDTGLFASTVTLTPSAGLVPYEIVSPQWSDGSTKQFLLALPGTATIEFEGVKFPFRGGRDGWKFPDGTVLVETHFLRRDDDNQASQFRVETRLLHHERLSGPEQVGDQLWRGYSYLWNDEQTDATLVEDPRGLDRTFMIRDSRTDGGTRRQTWHVPGRTECSICHNMAAKYVLGCQTLQMNQFVVREGERVNQIDYLARLGLFSAPLPQAPDQLPRLVDYHDHSQPLVDRARSYLHANCSHCHRNGGGGNADFFALASIDIEEMRLINAKPNHGTFFIPHAALVKSGRPLQSLIYFRMSSLGGGRMPRLGSQVVDEQGLELIYDWIAQMPPAEPEAAGDPDETPPAATQWDLSESQSVTLESIDAKLQSTVGALTLAREIATQQVTPTVRDAIISRAAISEPHIRDLFERFLPEEQRVKRLGVHVVPEEILAIPGDRERGEHLFEQSSMQCRSCHRINNQGGQVGPELDSIGKKFNRAQLLTSILDPSATIDAPFLQYQCTTTDGRTHSGILVEKTGTYIVLRNAQSQAITIDTDTIDDLSAQSKSIMPDLLVKDLTSQQLADLIAYLSSLRK